MDEQERLGRCLPMIREWYAASHRLLPWRREPTPYQVWISEIMLQQTRIEAVIPYYERFLRQLPDVEALAAVEEDRLLKLWEGLGYYSRARNLKKAAVQIMERFGGRLPQTAKELKSLPGIGDYTAGAIASIACGEPEPAVDGNVLRVLTRLLACPEDIASPKTKERLTALLRRLYPSGKAAGELTEGIMELGETVCVPNGEARCELCPLRSLCAARLSGAVERYPVKSPKAPRRVEERTVLLLRRGDRWAIRRREEKGLLAGLWEFPNVPGTLGVEEAMALAASWGAEPENCQPCGSAKHIFTHVEWHMRGYVISCAEAAPGFTWETGPVIAGDYSVPTAFKAWRKRILQE